VHGPLPCGRRQRCTSVQALTVRVPKRRVWPPGTALNSGSDWYKAGAKAAGGGMVTTGPYSWSLRPNYLGDWLRSAEAEIEDALL
jgi:hypothetical protein